MSSNLLYSVLRSGRSQLARSVIAYSWASRHFGSRGVLATKECDIVVEGFPRSGNTFAVHALRMANPGAVIAHHTHAPANVLLAADLNLPTIVVIRPVRDAVRSELIREPRKSPRRAVTEWLQFYSSITSVMAGLVVAEFSVVTSRYDAVIEAVNDKFGTSFELFFNSVDSDAAVFAAIEDGARRRGKHGMLLESQVPRPSVVRRKAGDPPSEVWQDVRLNKLLARADDLYAEFLNAAPTVA